MSVNSVSGRLSVGTMNQRVVKAEYAVRGAIVLRAEAIKKLLATNSHSYPFNKIVHCNIGNPHELGQIPITFFRQVIALCQYPQLLAHRQEKLCELGFEPEAVDRANHYLRNISGGMGAYTNSQGIKVVRDEVAAFIERRDGYPSDADNIFLTDGASSGVKSFLQCIIANPNDGVMVPIPQYPLYTATLTLCGGEAVHYYADEAANWGVTRNELERSLAAATKNNIRTRAIVVINPGNPTGQCLSRAEMEDVVSFCEHHSLILMADEVYQTNIYNESRPFVSFHKVVRDRRSDIQLISYHSVSKGVLGECGQRGGYFELVNFDESVKEQLYKMASVSLCSNVNGQVMTGLMVNPPHPSTRPYALYVHETTQQLASLKRRAQKVVSALNQLQGVTCNRVDGAMYAFPSIRLPKKFVDECEAKKKSHSNNMAADAQYCMELLEKTGLVVVPGSGFGQRDGTWHFRTTILPPEADLDVVMGGLADRKSVV